ncbi:MULTISPECIES: hypothetical protein [Streptomyces]|nr:hypothetical protein [Streptomyces melanosporofaciens]
MADESYDVMVIGTSQGGRFPPIDLAKAGRKVGSSSAATWAASA